MLRSSAARAPEKEALVHGDQRLTYADVSHRTSGLADGLRRAGLSRGDRVGIYLDPSVSQVLSIFGVSEAGGVFVPINSALFPEQVAYISEDCGIKALITTPAKLASLAPLLAQMPSLQFVVATSEQQAPSLPIPCLAFEDLCTLPSAHCAREQAIEKDLAAILYTSGSTGKPKGVMLSHANVMAGSSIVSTYLGITSRAHSRGPAVQLRRRHESAHDRVSAGRDADPDQFCVRPRSREDAAKGAHHRLGRGADALEPALAAELHTAEAAAARPALHHEHRRRHAAAGARNAAANCSPPRKSS